MSLYLHFTYAIFTLSLFNRQVAWITVTKLIKPLRQKNKRQRRQWLFRLEAITFRS